MNDLVQTPPRSVILVKLSAIGDVCHTLPVVRALQRAWPNTRFTWIIGRTEATFVSHLADIEFIVFDKKAGRQGRLAVKAALNHRTFDIALHLQFAWRASQLMRLIKAPIKLGFDRARALDLQWLFTNQTIASVPHQHVMDGLLEFTKRLGVTPTPLMWNIPIPPDALNYANRVINGHQPVLIISPCSSHPLRNWHAAGYAAVADYAATALNMQVLLCGGRTDLEREMATSIQSLMQAPCKNLVGQDTLIEFYATLSKASVLLTPDSGPAHMATALGIPVVGLYAATNPERSGPYFSRALCVNCFDQAAQTFLHKKASALPWRSKIEKSGVMDLITGPAVIDKLPPALQRQQISPSTQTPA